MNRTEVELWAWYRAKHEESIEQRHAEVMGKMALIGPPIGFAGLDLPPAPDCGKNLGASYRVKFPIRGLKCEGDYLYRNERYVYRDEAKFDDYLRFGFKTSNKALDYRAILYEHYPKVIEAFRGYRAYVTFFYEAAYSGGYEPSEDGRTAFDSNGYPVENNPVYNRLREDPSIDIDGRNNIYTLRPAHYWDAELCCRALGYGPDEVIKRLQGKALMVKALMDGVYLVLNDDPNLSYQDFVKMNEYYKSILGLV